MGAPPKFSGAARAQWLRMVPAAQVIANPARHRMRALSAHSIRSHSARVPRRKLICALQRPNFRALRALEGALARRIGSMPLFLTRPRGRGRLMWPCHAAAVRGREILALWGARCTPVSCDTCERDV